MSTRRGLPAVSPPPSAAHRIVGDLHDDRAQAGRGARAAPPQRTKLTTQIAADVAEELRDAVVYLPTQGVRATMAAITEQALRQELERLREEHHHGERFPPRGDWQLPPGRPIDVSPKTTP